MTALCILELDQSEVTCIHHSVHLSLPVAFRCHCKANSKGQIYTVIILHPLYPLSWCNTLTNHTAGWQWKSNYKSPDRKPSGFNRIFVVRVHGSVDRWCHMLKIFLINNSHSELKNIFVDEWLPVKTPMQTEVPEIRRASKATHRETSILVSISMINRADEDLSGAWPGSWLQTCLANSSTMCDSLKHYFLLHNSGLDQTALQGTLQKKATSYIFLFQWSYQKHTGAHIWH